ncbi:hypothetical protein CNMCM5878_008815 [Aspergillus fumigatiaffinis]|nr:hypothetical protein CNMCM5878_008815 [Aspergillus fumigatiaffinis]
MILPSLMLFMVALATTVTSHYDDPINIKSLLGPLLSPGAQLYLPSDPEYYGVNERWSNIGAPLYAAAVQPATEEDVRITVKVATEHDVPFLATGTSHSVKPGLPGYTTLRNAIHIDLSQLNGISVDSERNTMTVGPGVTNEMVYNTLYAAKREAPIATDRCISTLGTMVGGGLGSLQGVRGILADSLLSAHIVTAAGDLITVSKDDNPDLFWAIRGAGQNFGILVSATFRTYEQTNDGLSMFGDFIFPNSQNVSVFELVASLDEGLETGVFYGVIGTMNGTSKQPVLTLRLIVMGDESYAAPHLAKVMALNPVNSTWGVKEWKTYGDSTATMCDPGWNATLYSLGLERTDVQTLSEAWTNWTTFSIERGMFNGFWMIERHPEQVLLSVPKGERGVYPWRDTKIYMFYVNYMSDMSQKSEVHSVMGSIRDKLQDVMGFEHQHAYVNEAYGDEGPEMPIIHDEAHNKKVIYRTGDLVYYDSQGNLRYACREDSQVKIRGHRVELRAIETQIGRNSVVEDVRPVDDADQSVLVAFIPVESLSVRRLDIHEPAGNVPIAKVDEAFKRSAARSAATKLHGKVDRLKLRSSVSGLSCRQILELAGLRHGVVMPSREQEQTLHRLIVDLLNLRTDEVGCLQMPVLRDLALVTKVTDREDPRPNIKPFSLLEPTSREATVGLAAQTVIANPILRTRIIETDGKGMHQVVVRERIELTNVAEDQPVPTSFGGRLINANLIEAKDGDSDSFMILTMRHAICDRWSVLQLMCQVESAYDGIALSPNSFSRFIQHIRDMDITAAEAYWKSQFVDDPTNQSATWNPNRIHNVHDTPTRIRYCHRALFRFFWRCVRSYGHRPGCSRACGGNMTAPTVATIPLRVKLEPNRKITDALDMIQAPTIEMTAFEQTGLQGIYLTSRQAIFGVPFDLAPIQQLFFERKSKVVDRFNREFLSDGQWQQMLRHMNDSNSPYVHRSVVRRDALDAVPTATRRSLNIESGPVFAAHLVDVPDDECQYLFLVAHHLYLERGADLHATVGIFPDVVLSAGPVLQGISPSSPGTPALPQNHFTDPKSLWGFSGRANIFGDIATEKFTVDWDVSQQQLGGANQAFNTRPVEIFNAIVLYSFAAIFQDRPPPLVFSEGHGREPWDRSIDLTQTVGWFTTLWPVSVDMQKGEGFIQTLRLVKDARRQIPKNGWAYFASRYLHLDGRQSLHTPYSAEIIFNYTGEYQQLEQPNSFFQSDIHTIQGALDPADDVERLALLDVTVSMSHGRLQFHFIYNRQ